MTIIDISNPAATARLRAHELAQMELDNWESAIVDLNTAITDAAVARDRLCELGRRMDIEEARVILGASGGNSETRKAAVTLALNEECPAYQALAAQQRDVKLTLADAERRTEVARQQCRLLQAAVQVQIAGGKS